MPSLSATTLKLFQECPRCFWLHVNKKIERPRGPFPSLPSGIDRVLKAYFDGYRHDAALPPLIQGKLPGRLSRTDLTLGFTDPKLGARLWGKLDDCVILPDQRLAPLDHKTRASAPDDVSYSERYYKFQMDIYTLLLERNGQPAARTAYLVYYYPLESKLHQGFQFGVTVHELTTEPEAAYEVFAGGAKCLAGPLPESAPTCEFCRWIAVRQAPSSAPAAAREAGAASGVSSERNKLRGRRQRKIAPPAQIPEDLFA